MTVERLALEMAAHRLPDYAATFPEPCACGRCPHARDQTATTELRKVCIFDGGDLFARNYRCGVCGVEHRRQMVIRTAPELQARRTRRWIGENEPAPDDR